MTTGNDGQADRKGRDWTAMTDRRAFDADVKETQGSLFAVLPDKATAGDVPLFGDIFGQDIA